MVLLVVSIASPLVVETLAGADTYAPASQLPFTGLSVPNEVAVNAAGDILVSSLLTSVEELPAGCTSSSCVTEPFASLDIREMAGATIDRAGDAFAFSQIDGLNEMPAGCTSASCSKFIAPAGDFPSALGHGFNPIGVDAAGDLFVGSMSQVVEIPAGCGASSCFTLLPFPAFKQVISMSVDPSGDVLVAAEVSGGANETLELPSGCAQQSCVESLPVVPAGGVALDARGDRFVLYLNAGSKGEIDNVAEIPPACQSAACVSDVPVPVPAPSVGLAVGPTGDLYSSDADPNVNAVFWFALNPPTTTTVTASPASPFYGESVTLSATTSPTDGIGSTSFYLDGSATPIGGCAGVSLSQSGSTATASCTTSALPVGSDSITAMYSGSQLFQGSTSLPYTLIVSRAPTTLNATPVLELHPLHSNLLQLSATLTGPFGAVGGQSITFSAGGKNICTATTSSAGIAHCDGVLGLASILLDRGYVANYAGNTDYLPSAAKGAFVS